MGGGAGRQQDAATKAANGSIITITVARSMYPTNNQPARAASCSTTLLLLHSKQYVMVLSLRIICVVAATTLDSLVYVATAVSGSQAHTNRVEDACIFILC